MPPACLHRVIILHCIFLFFTSRLFAQQDKAPPSPFDSSFNYIATTLATQNVGEAIKQSQQLYKRAADSFQGMKSLMLIATLEERTGDRPVAIQYAFRAGKIAEYLKDKEWQMRIAGFLSTNFRELGLFAEGKKYLSKVEQANSGSKVSPLIALLLCQEKAYYEIENQNYKSALKEIKSANEILSSAPENSAIAIYLATNLQLEGLCLLKLGKPDEAKVQLDKALSVLDGQESTLRGFVFQNLAEVYLKKDNPKEAIRNLDSAMQYAVNSDNFNLKAYTYQSLSQYYLRVGDKAKAMEFQLKYAELSDFQATLTANVANTMIEQFDSETQKHKQWNAYLYIFCSLLIATIGIVFFYSRRLRKKERAKYLEYIQRLSLKENSLNKTLSEAAIAEEAPDEDALHMPLAEELEEPMNGALEIDELQSVPALADIANVENEKQGVLISKETEQRILNDLYKWELRLQYLKPDITLTSLASRIKTNTKYLSFIINDQKGKDFNNYINELRVNYIINKLQEDPVFRDYKIAYLAQEAGFSTHSKFATTFKAITGISPSAFISNLKMDEKTVV